MHTDGHMTHITSATRFYVDNNDLKADVVRFFRERANLQSQCRIEAYNMCFSEVYDINLYNSKNNIKLSMYNNLKSRYPELNVYEINSALNDGKGTFKGQQTSREKRITGLKDKIEEQEGKIKNTENKLNKYIKSREAFLQYRTSYFNGDNEKYKPELRNIKAEEGLLKILFGKNKEEYGPYEAEYEFFNTNIKNLRNRLRLMNEKLERLNNNLKVAEDVPERAFFRKSKYQTYRISGRADLKFKNPIFLCKHTKGSTFEITVRINKKNYVFETEFPYDSQYLIDALHTEMPICFAIKEKKDGKGNSYFQFETSFDKSKAYVDASDINKGAFGIDFNVDHLDYAETDKHGNLVDYGTIKFTSEDDTDTNKHTLSEACKTVIEKAGKAGKPVIIEDLKFTDLKKQDNGKKQNKRLHNLAYTRFRRYVSYRCIENNIGFKTVSPAFTIFIGLAKYAKERNIPCHCSAAYVIARRGMEYSEKILNKHKHYIEDYVSKSEWKRWSDLQRINNQLIKNKYKKNKYSKARLAHLCKSEVAL